MSMSHQTTQTAPLKHRQKKQGEKKWLFGLAESAREWKRDEKKEFKISSISDLMVFDRKWNGMNIKQNDINNRQ